MVSPSTTHCTWFPVVHRLNRPTTTVENPLDAGKMSSPSPSFTKIAAKIPRRTTRRIVERRGIPRRCARSGDENWRRRLYERRLRGGRYRGTHVIAIAPRLVAAACGAMKNTRLSFIHRRSASSDTYGIFKLTCRIRTRCSRLRETPVKRDHAAFVLAVDGERGPRQIRLDEVPEMFYSGPNNGLVRAQCSLPIPTAAHAKEACGGWNSVKPPRAFRRCIRCFSHSIRTRMRRSDLTGSPGICAANTDCAAGPLPVGGCKASCATITINPSAQAQPALGCRRRRAAVPCAPFAWRLNVRKAFQ